MRQRAHLGDEMQPPAPGLTDGSAPQQGRIYVYLFVKTIPRQMWSGIREQICPTILAVATILVFISICLLTVLELLRRRSERLPGVTPH